MQFHENLQKEFWLQNVLTELLDRRFCRVWWESSGFCSYGSFCVFSEVARCRALRLLELFQFLFYVRESLVISFVLFVCASIVSCVLCVCALSVDAIWSRIRSKHSSVAGSMIFAFFGSGSTVAGWLWAHFPGVVVFVRTCCRSRCRIESRFARRGSVCLRARGTAVFGQIRVLFSFCCC